MKMIPRDYQQEATTLTCLYLRAKKGHPCIVLPTGAGKSLVMALLMQALSGARIILVTHNKELLLQIGKTLQAIGIDDFGYYSAGLGKRDTQQRIILANIQSAYSRPEAFGHRDFILIDEAHRINPKSTDTMYGKFFAAFPDAFRIGLTATPYRLASGTIVDEDSWLTEIIYEISVRELVDRGFLSRLTSKWMNGISTEGLAIRNKEFAEEDQQRRFLEITDQICADVIERTKDRHSVLFFCSGVEAVHRTQAYFRSQGLVCGAITGDTEDDVREEYIEAFRTGQIKFLANCNVLTEGFDAPNIDAVVLARATLSPGLYYQMAGRGLRKHESKENCLILDYGENIARHGPIDRVSPNVGGRQSGNGKAPVKQCPNCFEAVAIQSRTCETCDFVFEIDDDKTKKLKDKPSREAAMSDEDEGRWYRVGSMTMRSHAKKSNPDGPKTMAVSYYEGLPLGHPIARQFICVEHTGFARNKAQKWWSKLLRIIPMPDSAEEAAKTLTKAIENKSAIPPLAIRCKQSSYDPRFLEVVELSWSKKDVPLVEEFDDDEFL